MPAASSSAASPSCCDVRTTPLEPRQLGQEQLLLSRVLGRGGFSTVYKAIWTPPGASAPTPISVKVLLPRYSSSTCIHWKQFVDEANFLHGCDHMNVIKCHGLVLLPPHREGLKESYAGPVLAMLLDYAKDGTLLSLLTNQMIEPHSRLYSLRQALHVLVDVADGLAHLHGSRPAVVHRDIKPGNVLLDKGRRAGTLGADARDAKDLLTARIADFGLHVPLGDERPKLLRQSRRASGPGTQPTPPGTGADTTATSNLFFTFLGAPEGSGDMRRTPVVLAAEKAVTTVSQQSSGVCSVRPRATPRLSTRGYNSSLTGSCDGLQRRSTTGVEAGVCVPASVPAVERTSSAAPAAAAAVAAAAAAAPQFSSPQPPDGGGGGGGLHADLDGWREDSAAPSSQPTASGELPPGDSAGFGGGHATDVVVLSDGDEAEWVFDLTEATGSLVYMAPEVHLKLPYNTKADVYSFGVMMYEVLARTLLAKTCIGGKVRSAEDYMRRVLDGWRPERPDGMAPELWQLLGACWQADPNRRPSMVHVAAELRVLLPALASEEMKQEGACHSCVIS